MSFYINHPSEWIGVPEYWPYPQADGPDLETSHQWVSMLVDELAELDATFGDPEREHVTSVLTLAAQRSESTGERCYVAFESWSGAAYIVATSTFSSQQLEGRSLAQHLGAEETGNLAETAVEPFDTESGVTGLRYYRYLVYDASIGSLYGRADYGFEKAGAVLTLTAAELDLDYFRKLLPLMEKLAAGVSWNEA